MKKLLILMLVLGLTSLASADLVFTVNGELQPEEITLYPSDEIVLDLHLTEGQTILQYQLMYELSNEQAEFITEGIVFPWASMFAGKIYSEGPGFVEISASNFMMSVPGPLDLMDGLVIHCLEATDVVLTVTNTSDNTTINGEVIPAGTLMHTLVIHQIPEPATIALLGLGGLLMLRRQRR